MATKIIFALQLFGLCMGLYNLFLGYVYYPKKKKTSPKELKLIRSLAWILIAGISLKMLVDYYL
jgi:hypothetical protein